MDAFQIQNVSFTYPSGKTPALSKIDLNVKEGSFTLLCGPSGCGKSTLLRLMKRTIAPAGVLEGEIYYLGTPLEQVEARRLAGEIGFVFQNPERQFVSDQVEQELSFSLECLGVPPESIRTRVAESAAFFGIERYFEQKTNALSGGEQQLLNLAAVMAADPSVLLLDEPLAQLDPVAQLDFLTQLRRVNQELGVTVILAEHHLDEVFPLCDQVVVMEQGRILQTGSREETGRFLLNTRHPMAQALPAAARLLDRLGAQSAGAADCAQARAWLQKKGYRAVEQLEPKSARQGKHPLLACKGVCFSYQRMQPVLSDLDFSVQQGECTAIIGGNGAGKSTLLRLIAGDLKPQRGKIKCAARGIGYLPQNPYHTFLMDSLRSDFEQLARRLGLSASAWRERQKQYPFFSALDALMERNPFDLSGGEAQRAALCKLLMAGNDFLLLDEPTKGLDAPACRQLLLLLRQLQAQGVTLLLVSHDLEFVASCAQACVFLFRGQVAARGTPKAVFCSNRFYTTPLRRVTKGFFAEAVTLKDVEAQL